jgi:two-component system, OmpR family, phosphate regulon sensor histidine kinase PhoR
MNNEPTLARLLVEALDEPVLLVRNNRVTLANGAAKALLGGGIEDGDVRLAIRHPQALETILAGQAAETEVSGIAAPGRPWQLIVRPLGDGTLLVRLADRSATRAAEQMRVDFVANASHELRTPLATILGYAETLSEEADLTPDLRRRFGGLIHSESRRMLRIVEDLMSLSRIEADRFVAPTDQIAPDDIVRLAADHGRRLAEEYGASIELELAEALPPVRGDTGQLLQMLDNLVANAIRYGCSGQSRQVRVGARAEGDGVLLWVADQGEGIARRHLPRLTERFYRVDDARSRDSGGTGLGLAIVKHIVERHRGTLEIRSSPGLGTEVRVRLPAAGPLS